ncbi:MAG: hypothetical protein ACTHMQ_13705 [Protaetiibacter sp.]
MSDVAPLAAPQPVPAAFSPLQQPVDPFRTATLSPWGHAVAAALALGGIVLNVIGGAGFPSNAPVEWIMNAGLTIDLVAVFIACAIGFGVSVRMRPARPSLVFPWLGLGFAALALVAWALASQGLWETLLADGRGRYMNDTAGAFYLGVPWTLGAIFSAYGVRGRSRPHLNAVAFTGIGLWAIVLIGVLASALLYAADLTD